MRIKTGKGAAPAAPFPVSARRRPLPHSSGRIPTFPAAYHAAAQDAPGIRGPPEPSEPAKRASSDLFFPEIRLTNSVVVSLIVRLDLETGQVVFRGVLEVVVLVNYGRRRIAPICGPEQ